MLKLRLLPKLKRRRLLELEVRDRRVSGWETKALFAEHGSESISLVPFSSWKRCNPCDGS